MHARLRPASASDPTAVVGREPAAARVRKRPVLVWNEQLDLLIHALAQLPDALRLEVDAPRPELGVLQLLAGAYGIDDRVTFQESDGRLGALFRPDLFPSGSAIRPGSTMANVLEGVSRPEDPPASLRAPDVALANQRVAIVTNLPAHYRLPLFSEMSKRLSAVHAVLRVLFLARDAGSRPWLSSSPENGFDFEFVPSVELPLRARRALFPLTLERRLASFQPTIVLVAGLSPFVAGRAARFARHRDIPYGIWSGETPRAGTAQSAARRAQRVRLAQRASFGVAYGSAAAEYLGDLRPDLPLVYGRNTAPVISAPRRRTIPDRVEILCVGDLASPRKGVDVAIDALGLCPDLGSRLSVIGGGKLMGELAARAACDARVRVLGPLPPAAVQSAYADADVVLFPTRFDIFGLVLVEAMGAGVATVVSGAAGAVADLAIDEHNCLVVDGQDPRLWAKAVTRVVNDADLRRSLGENARRTIERRWTIAHAADAMIAGLRLAVLQVEGGGRNGE